MTGFKRKMSEEPKRKRMKKFQDNKNPNLRVPEEEIPEELKGNRSFYNLYKVYCKEHAPHVGKSKLLHLLREKLLQHKWEDAALIMEGLAAYTEWRMLFLGETLWKVGNEIIYNHPQSKLESNLALQHRQAMKSANVQMDEMHVLFEYVLYLIMRKDFEAAKETLTFFRPLLRGRKNITKLINPWMPVFEGYLGLLYYVSWKELQLSPRTRAQVSEEEQSLKTTTADQALEHFGNALNAPRVLDTFVTKQIEILRSAGFPEEEDRVVKKYVEMNPGNPNAVKYYYEYLSHYPEATDSEKRRVEVLSMLHEVAPSEIYVLDLHRLLLEKSLRAKSTNGEFVSEMTLAMSTLMDFLDYDSRMHNLEGWKNLAVFLHKTLKACDNKVVTKLRKVVWQDCRRNSWWPKYHFTNKRAEQSCEGSSELAVAKSLVAAFFLSESCQFCSYVKKYVTEYNAVVAHVLS